MSVLTQEQEAAVARRSEPLLLAAGAGSGKTSVLVERFVRAVCEDGVAPARVLAITFTDRAAGELRERVRGRLLELSGREAARETEAAFVSTFHAFCARLLRAHPLLAGLDPRFAILDESVARRIRERAFALGLGDFLARHGSGEGEAVDLVAAYGPDRVQAMILGTHAQLRSRGQRHPRLPAAADPARDPGAAQAYVLLGELLERFDTSYERLKRARGGVDFDDLELHALELLAHHASVREAWSERFELLMVDEFQDTNPRQLEILGWLERGNLFTVGDELQSIYGFRDADVRLFRAREAHLRDHGGSLELRRNFRSRRALLDVVNVVFEARLGEAYRPLEAHRPLVADPPASRGGDPPDGEHAEEPAVELLLTSRRGWNGDGEPAGGDSSPASAGGVPGWRRAEARLLAARVAELVQGGGVRAGDVVVLLRAVVDVGCYERALQDRGLRTLAAVGGFWSRQQVRDLLAYVRALANPLDEVALYGTLASPLVGLSSDALALIASRAHARECSAWDAVKDGAEELERRLPDADGRALNAFRDRFVLERAGAGRRGIAQLIEREIAASGYRAHVLAREDGERRMANVNKLLRLARQFEASEGRDLRGFLDHVAHRAEDAGGPEPDAPVSDVEPDAVRLMSVHAAKGLEFDVVCVADLGRTANLSVPDLLVDGDRIGLRLARLDGGEAVASFDFDALSEERKRAQAEEEDRILYVAMTRARDRLLLSGAVDFEHWPEPRLGAPPITWLGPAITPDIADLVRAQAEAPSQTTFDLRVGPAPGVSVRCLVNVPPGDTAAMVAAGADAARARGLDGEPSAAPQPAEEQLELPISPAVMSVSGDPVGAPLEEIGSLSYTALSELERCGYRFYLERVLGLEEERSAQGGDRPREGLDGRARGTLAHRLLELVDFARGLSPSVEEAAAVARVLGVRLSRRERTEIVAMVDALVAAATEHELGTAPNPAARLAAASYVRREHPFALAIPNAHREPARGQGLPALLTGVIDVLAKEVDGGWLVVDYKSDRVTPEESLDELVERSYELQRMLYALAVLRADAPSVEVVHWFLERPHEWVVARFQARDRGSLEDRLSERIELARGRGFLVSEHPHRGLCEGCPGRAALCSWDEAATMRDRPEL